MLQFYHHYRIHKPKPELCPHYLSLQCHLDLPVSDLLTTLGTWGDVFLFLHALQFLNHLDSPLHLW